MIRQASEETLEIVSYSPTQTQQCGMRLGESLCGGELLLLDGQLGAGKTTFTQGLAKGMGITAIVSSPTFTLLKEYTPGVARGRGEQGDRSALALYHFDLYRLEEPEEIIDLGFEDYVYTSTPGVCVVEWAGRAGNLWPPERLTIRLTLIDEMKRSLLFMAMGERYCELLRQLQKTTYAIASA